MFTGNVKGSSSSVACRATLTEGVGVDVGVDVDVGVVAHPARSPNVSRANVRVVVGWGDVFNRFPSLDGGFAAFCLYRPHRADAFLLVTGQ